ncbi:MAG: hypothetical protein IKP44_06805 [Bacteroidaceae bacterium]|nr:hypothetical protein [Bacteroidaceae bacterium]
MKTLIEFLNKNWQKLCFYAVIILIISVIYKDIFSIGRTSDFYAKVDSVMTDEGEQQERTGEEQVLSRITYSLAKIFSLSSSELIKPYIDKDGFLIVGKIGDDLEYCCDYGYTDYHTNYRYVYLDGQHVTYNPRITSSDLYPYLIQEIKFILTLYSLRADPEVRSNEKIKSSQYEYYLVFGEGDVSDFVKEKVRIHYAVAEDQSPGGEIQEYKTSSAGSFRFKYCPSNYEGAYDIVFYYDDDGYLIVETVG